MRTIHHVLDIAAEPSAVYRAAATVAGLTGWWSTEVRAEERVGGVVHFTFAEDFNPDMEITTLDEPNVVEWRCVGGHEPWADNTFRFEVVEGSAGARLRFWQHYATELSDDAYGIYNFNWGYYLESLRLLCTTGEGKPFDPTGA